MKALKPNIRAIILTVAMGLLSGCGAQYNNQDPHHPISSSSSASLSVSAYADWNCPSDAGYNIKAPASSTSYSAEFRVCRSKTDPSKFLIDGHWTDETWAIVCIYPMSRSANGLNLTLVENKRCYNVKSGNVVTDFDSNNINYMYMVPNNQTVSMENCLMGGSCPPNYIQGEVK